MPIEFRVNGQKRTVDVDPTTPLLWVLRETLELTGTKFGCGAAQCGVCTVHLDGRAVRSCVLPVSAAAGKDVTTIEVQGHAVVAALQKAWAEIDVPQCGYCQAGQIMTAAAFLKGNPAPTDDEIDGALAGNLCRCGTYVRIRAAVKDAATAMAKEGAK